MMSFVMSETKCLYVACKAIFSPWVYTWYRDESNLFYAVGADTHKGLCWRMRVRVEKPHQDTRQGYLYHGRSGFTGFVVHGRDTPGGYLGVEGQCLFPSGVSLASRVFISLSHTSTWKLFLSHLPTVVKRLQVDSYQCLTYISLTSRIFVSIALQQSNLISRRNSEHILKGGFD